MLILGSSIGIDLIADLMPHDAHAQRCCIVALVQSVCNSPMFPLPRNFAHRITVFR